MILRISINDAIRRDYLVNRIRYIITIKRIILKLDKYSDINCTYVIRDKRVLTLKKKMQYSINIRLMLKYTIHKSNKNDFCGFYEDI